MSEIPLSSLSLGWRFWALMVASILLALCLAKPTIVLKRPVFRYLFVIDITQSMNASDYRLAGMPANRLGFVKAAIQQALERLPCGSEVGLGLFATRNSLLLFEPLETCEHYPLIIDVLEHIDWRMAWSADSHIARGLYTGIREAAARGNDTRLVFFSDGQQFPPVTDLPAFDGKPGAVGGLIIGVGGAQPVPIPRYDKENHPLGFWEYVDLRDYLPPSEIPKDATNLFLTRLDEPALSHLAAITGLDYHRLETPVGLTRALTETNLAAERIVAVDIRWVLGLLAFLLLLVTKILNI